MDEPAAYVVEGLHKRYRDQATPANRDITLAIPAGEVFGLLGPNGAGKTTLVRQLAGLVRPDAGRITMFGEDIAGNASLPARWIGYLAQDEPALAEMPVRVAVETTARLRGVPRRAAGRSAAAVLDELDLGEIADRPMVKLSGGQRRLGCLAATLPADRPVLILDEPTAGLDPAVRRTTWAALRRRRDAGTTIVLVTHNVGEAEQVLDRVAVLDRGAVIACDTPRRLTAAVDDHVRVELVWRREPPIDDSVVARLAAASRRHGLAWSARLPRGDVRGVLGRLMSGPVMDALDDVTVAAPSLEDVYLALGGHDDDLERQ